MSSFDFHAYKKYPTMMAVLSLAAVLNCPSQAAVKQLAEADMQEVVKEVREIYIDFLPIGQPPATHYFSPVTCPWSPVTCY